MRRRSRKTANFPTRCTPNRDEEEKTVLAGRMIPCGAISTRQGTNAENPTTFSYCSSTVSLHHTSNNGAKDAGRSRQGDLRREVHRRRRRRFRDRKLSTLILEEKSDARRFSNPPPLPLLTVNILNFIFIQSFFFLSFFLFSPLISLTIYVFLLANLSANLPSYYRLTLTDLKKTIVSANRVDQIQEKKKKKDNNTMQPDNNFRSRINDISYAINRIIIALYPVLFILPNYLNNKNYFALI